VQKLGGLAFANGYIRRDSKRIVRASAVFMLLAAKSASSAVQELRTHDPNNLLRDRHANKVT
jgi:hypothetical protein